MPASRAYSVLPNTACSRSTTRRTAGPDRSSCAASTAASNAMSVTVYRFGKMGRQVGLRWTRRVFIQRRIQRVNCARLSPVIFTRNRRTIPFSPRLNRRLLLRFQNPLDRLINGFSRRRDKADRSTPLHKFTHLVQRQSLYILHGDVHSPAASHPFLPSPIQAHLALETIHPSRLVRSGSF